MYSASALTGTRIAFDTRTCRSSPRSQSWYTVDRQTPSRLATSGTVMNPCKKVVRRSSRIGAKGCEFPTSGAPRDRTISTACIPLLPPATPPRPPVTPEAAGSSPVHPAGITELARVLRTGAAGPRALRPRLDHPPREQDRPRPLVPDDVHERVVGVEHHGIEVLRPPRLRG